MKGFVVGLGSDLLLDPEVTLGIGISFEELTEV